MKNLQLVIGNLQFVCFEDLKLQITNYKSQIL